MLSSQRDDDNDGEVVVMVAVAVDRVTCRQSRRCTEGDAMIFYLSFGWLVGWLVGVYLSRDLVILRCERVRSLFLSMDFITLKVGFGK